MDMVFERDNHREPNEADRFTKDTGPKTGRSEADIRETEIIFLELSPQLAVISKPAAARAY
jgi:hypothetical protein